MKMANTPVLIESEFHDVVTEAVKNYGIKLNQSFCPKDIPSVTEYLSAISNYGIVLLTIGALALVLVLAMFIDTLKYIMKHSPPRVKAHSAFVIGVYPVVALASYVATLVPRAALLAEATTQGIFMAGMYQLFCLFVAYCGGEAEMIRKVKPETLSLKVSPCCCWPCCCFPLLNITKDRVRYLRLLVLQLPVVQGLVYMALLVMWAERESLYQVNYLYLVPVIIVSILFGVWGMSMTINLLREVLKGYSMPGKFMVLQLVLLFAKLQGLITRILAWTGVLPCKPHISSEVYGNLIHNSLMLAEMVMLGFIARRLYKQPLPEEDVPKCVVTTISVLANNVKDSANNNLQTLQSLNVEDGDNTRV